MGLTQKALADKAGISKEVSLLRDIAIAYPVYIAKECGADIDAEKETAAILDTLKRKNKPAKE